MTFHFAHLAPPGADTLTAPAARWVRCPLTRRLVMLWDRPVMPSATPAQPEPAPSPVALSLTELRTA